MNETLDFEKSDIGVSATNDGVEVVGPGGGLRGVGSSSMRKTVVGLGFGLKYDFGLLDSG